MLCLLYSRQVLITSLLSNSYLFLIGTCCGFGKYIPATCSGGTEELPKMSDTWQVDINVTSGQVTWFNIYSPSNRVLLSTISDFSNMYHIVMVVGEAVFNIYPDNTFMNFKNNPTYVGFPSNISVTVDGVSGITTTRIIGEKITSTSVTSYQITLSSFGGWFCFGLSKIPDINAVILNGGDYDNSWGPCVNHTGGNKWPIGQLDFVCPCEPCHAQCTRCSGPSENECSACNTGFYLQSASTSCLNTCPAGYWKDDTNHICAECHSACSNCADGTDTQCSACKINYYLQPAPSDTTCDSTCPDGYWGDDATQSCQVCHSFCSECSGPNSNECSACKSGYFLQGSTCMTCHLACSVCAGSLDSQCSACNPNHYLQPPPSDTTCLGSCPNGYWLDDESNQCQPCHAFCSICTSSSHTECTVCNSGFFLQPSSTTCSDSCPDGYWLNSTSNVCENCDISCAICSSSDNTQCSACKSGYFLQPSLTTCLSTCPTHYYANTSLNTCESKSHFY